MLGRIGRQVGATPLLTWFSMGTLAIPMRWNRSVKATWMQRALGCHWLPDGGVVLKSEDAWCQDFRKLAVKHWRSGYIWQAQMKSAVANEKDVLYMTSSPFIIKLFATWSMKSGLTFYVYSFSLPGHIQIYQDKGQLAAFDVALVRNMSLLADCLPRSVGCIISLAV